MANPASHRSRVSRSVIFTPAAEALREPMMATSDIANTRLWPRIAISGGLDFLFGLFARANSRSAAAAAAGEGRESLERRACSAAMVEQRAESARPYILASDEPQPVEPLLIRQSYGFAALAHCWPSNDP
jgi:hypothetical protein